MRALLKFLGVICAATGVLVAAKLASAHHSTTMFDHSKTLTIRGVAMELRWVNPHVSLLVKGIVDGGEDEEEWLMEMTSSRQPRARRRIVNVLLWSNMVVE